MGQSLIPSQITRVRVATFYGARDTVSTGKVLISTVTLIYANFSDWLGSSCIGLAPVPSDGGRG